MRTANTRLLLFGLFGLMAATRAHGVDFRVESKVFVDKQRAPRSTNRTLFHADRAYDFLDNPEQVTIYNFTSGRCALIDPERNVVVDLSRSTVDAYCNSLRHLKGKSDDPLLDFALRPEFEERQDKTAWTFASKLLTYEVKATAEPVAGIASSYREFADASARLNAIVNRGSLPPFPRLEVNESLAGAGEVPLQIRMSIAPQKLLGRTVVLRSEHAFETTLSDADRRKVDEADLLLTAAKRVSLSEFLRSSTKQVSEAR